MDAEFSVRTRAANLAAMAERPLDVLVVGAGIVGAWIALTAALRGYRVALVDKGDFASGTSGKTSRLVHGGLRYLQQFRIGVVRESARERDVLLRIAPDLVKPLTFLIPVYADRGPKRWQLRVGLRLYDALSKEKALPPRRWLTREEAIGREPKLRDGGLVLGALYSDAMTHDARLVFRIVRNAAGAGALVANYARVAELLREGRRVAGARVADGETGTVREVRAAVVVNATGVWIGDLRKDRQGLRLRPTKGIHLFVPRDRLGNVGAVVLPAPDRRIVFVLPHDRFSLIGTTDTDYPGDRERVEADAGDVRYLLDVVNGYFPGASLTPEDVVGTYAGLRPLIRSAGRESDISRRHRIVVDRDGLVTIAGGKLTTARAMAEDVLRRASRRLPPPMRRADTRTITLAGQEVEWGEEDLQASVRYAARHEMALHIDDALVRRLGVFHLRPDHHFRRAAEIANLLGEELGWDLARRDVEVARYRFQVEGNERWRGPSNE